ncbi:HAD-IIA family hydrolase [Brachybacterium phenoliresistens]|uniref:Haloacid dehalogenase n=1 Tax=Brachybacterium phenoliresistens TaxID=396014 RepID=Z9JY82_9MICO|nr:HAD-IIA family hydrolase [Brachybacterium phenoliresistens]EWS82958.1 haloacid dehalogenase [Brachybacterium phenoliresistens]
MTAGPDSCYLDLYDALLLDLDGTVMHGPRPIEHAAEGILAGRDAGAGIAFVTNNASRTPRQVVDHLRTVGVEASEDEIVTSPQIAARLLAEQLEPGATVLVVGSEGLAEEVRGVGLEPVVEDREDVVAVIQGWDPSLGWARLAEGGYALRRGALWMATNTDATLPTEKGIAPGNGSLVAALRHATGREPQVAGKPEPGMFRGAADRLGARRPLAVGDRLDTDIEGGNRAGMDSLMVLTGVDSALDALRADPIRRPTWIEQDLSSLGRPAPRAVLEGERAQCGPVHATWEDGDIRLGGPAQDIRTLRCALALVAHHRPEARFTGSLRDAEGRELDALPAPDPEPAAL